MRLTFFLNSSLCSLQSFCDAIGSVSNQCTIMTSLKILTTCAGVSANNKSKQSMVRGFTMNPNSLNIRYVEGIIATGKVCNS